MGITVLVTLAAFLAVCSCQNTGDEKFKTRRLPNTEVCGRTQESLDRKIIGGSPVSLGAYPWMVNIGYKKSRSSSISWRCAGSLITDRHVITAAHCLHPDLLKETGVGWMQTVVNVVTTVRLGDLDLNPSVDDGANPMDFGVEKIIYHEQFDNTLKINDIGIIKLIKPVQFTEMIKPICLPPLEFRNNSFVGYSPVVAGWGTSVKGETRGTKLLDAEVLIIDTAECRKNMTSLQRLEKLVIDDRVVCASAPGKDACQGDSGGPLMFYRKLKSAPASSPGNVFLMGIVSYGYGCAQEGFPGVYTRVSKYMDWIIANLDI